MATRLQNRLGYTLTEVLVVLAIIALLSGLAVPAVVKIGGFLSNRSGEAARELYGILRAARTYSITYRVDTAVVYTVTGHKDSKDGAWSYVIDGFGIARRANPAERQYIATYLAAQGVSAATAATRADSAFIPVQSPDAQFQKMPDSTAVVGHMDSDVGPGMDATVFELPPQTHDDFRADLDEKGMLPVYLFHFANTNVGDALQELPYGIPVGVLGANYDPLYVVQDVPYSYPAHVFTPTGDMLASDNSAAARFVINVGPAPDAPVSDRYTVAPDEGTAVLVSPVRIELFRTTGRVKISS